MNVPIFSCFSRSSMMRPYKLGQCFQTSSFLYIVMLKKSLMVKKYRTSTALRAENPMQSPMSPPMLENRSTKP